MTHFANKIVTFQTDMQIVDFPSLLSSTWFRTIFNPHGGSLALPLHTISALSPLKYHYSLDSNNPGWRLIERRPPKVRHRTSFPISRANQLIPEVYYPWLGAKRCVKWDLAPRIGYAKCDSIILKDHLAYWWPDVCLLALPDFWTLGKSV